MALTRFTKPTTGVRGDRYRTEDHLGDLVWVRPTSLETGIVTEYDKEGTNVVLKADIFDVAEGKAYWGTLLFNSALVDGLGAYIGDEVVGSFQDVRTKDGKKTYRAFVAGDDADHTKVEKALDDIHAALDARYEELLAESKLAEEPAQAAATKGAFKR